MSSHNKFDWRWLVGVIVVIAFVIFCVKMGSPPTAEQTDPPPEVEAGAIPTPIIENVPPVYNEESSHRLYIPKVEMPMESTVSLKDYPVGPVDEWPDD